MLRVWPLRDAWTRETENLYAAWIEKLFDAPLDKELSWKSMDKVLHDPSRNILFNHLGLREDEKGAIIQPDCADVPYVLRAYFAFKMGLPFGYSKCTRGDLAEDAERIAGQSICSAGTERPIRGGEWCASCCCC